ncbi:MAG TPA: hypothetical protein VEG44_04635 [Candidatus Acidoferrales bacterium]|nr:hypothetical protein [Candidatus Acidoferrales bacterium]
MLSIIRLMPSHVQAERDGDEAATAATMHKLAVEELLTRHPLSFGTAFH